MSGRGSMRDSQPCHIIMWSYAVPNINRLILKRWIETGSPGSGNGFWGGILFWPTSPQRDESRPAFHVVEEYFRQKEFAYIFLGWDKGIPLSRQLVVEMRCARTADPAIEPRELGFLFSGQGFGGL